MWGVEMDKFNSVIAYLVIISIVQIGLFYYIFRNMDNK
jgi:hypothetical protein